jgi:hypothetical protein
MRFLIQKIDKEIRHDFAFTLLESIRYQKWKQGEDADVVVRYVNCKANDNVWFFKPFHQHYIPIGSVEFVTSWFKRFHDHTPKPINIPDELNEPFYTKRPVINGNHMDIEDLTKGKWFVKSATQIKGFAEMLRIDDNHSWGIPAGYYQMSEEIDIESEWRCFVYDGKLVGLQNYSGIFSMFPDIRTILHMVHNYKSAPIAYTLDVGVNNFGTFIIEVHDFFSCGLYGFANHDILPFMFTRWHYEYLKNTVYGK